ncbi:porin [Sediminitomix flava]|uniref:Phosphate-selective porin O/P n=1 Tax=Sediminitomix flava TaxID=379075 RepID=A0A315Z6H8_SEDFL|nr:porin [Sediminitomix flava]PWJ37971.1 phosphate-selective porin O/P [Sediminitomix flava]
MKIVRFLILILSLTSLNLYAQDIESDSTEVKKGAIEELKYIKQPGFANASSKIFSSDRRYSISGFGEINYVNYHGGPKNTSSGELELYYTNLYRFGTYFGYRFTDKFILMSELQMEFMHDGFNKGEFDYGLEFSFDYLFNPYFNVRVGNYPLGLGFVNVNEEPIAFYTVNRPEVERVLIPTQWLELGVNFYGNIIEDLEYHAGVTKGMDAMAFRTGTWVRDGRTNPFHDDIGGWAVNGKLQYGHEDHVLLALAGYYGDASMNNTLSFEGKQGQKLESNLGMFTAVGAYTQGPWSFFGMFMKGWLSGTEDLYKENIQRDGSDINQSSYVLGAETMGYYGEVRYDLFDLFKMNTEKKLPLFVRYEVVNTHQKVDDYFVKNDIDFVGNNLEVISVGLNFRPKKNWTFKADYQFRNNRYESAGETPNQFEMGVGFIY